MTLCHFRVCLITQCCDEQVCIQPGDQDTDLIGCSLIDTEISGNRYVAAGFTASANDNKQPVVCSNPVEHRDIFFDFVLLERGDQDRAAQRDDNRLHCTSFCAGCSYRVVEYAVLSCL